jgi:17-hydroxy-3-oxo-4-pregnene-20-carboxyl-CoA lyase
MKWKLRKQVAIVGIGQTKFTRPGASGRTAFSLACEAALGACADAGIDPKHIDGFATYGGHRDIGETTDPYSLAQTLGCQETHFMDRFPGGGESLAATIHHAAMAIHAGVCDTVLCWRSLSGRLIPTKANDVVTEPESVGGNAAFRFDFLQPFGAFVPFQYYAMQARRHMIEFGTTSRQFGAIAVSQNINAQRNPNAIHYGRPITLEDHQNGPMISDPYRLHDCTQEADGACAVLVVAADRAKDCVHSPVFLLGAAEGSGRPDQLYNQLRHQSRWNTAGFEEIARDLYSRAGIGPKDIHVAQIFETFTGQALMALEDFGFCARGEGGPFVESGSILFQGGSLPINTSGGGLAEAYIHGFNNLLEGVRQIRGSSTSQVRNAETCLVTSGPSAMPSSALILCS